MCTFVIFGASGDLAARKLMPALFKLHQTGALHPKTQLVGFSRREWSDEQFRQHLKAALQEGANAFRETLWQELAPRLSFVQGGYDDLESYRRLAEHLEGLEPPNSLFYTATPPQAYTAIIKGLQGAGLNHSPVGWVRIVIEKPYGDDLESATRLNEVVLEAFEEQQVYRIDHYLAKETAQNIAALRFANTIFEPLWSNQYVDHVQITMAESIGIEGRGGFYEEAGVIRDVFQNHLLQLVALTATEPPTRFDARSVRDEKVKVFRAMCCASPAEAVIGQYVAGDGMKGYREEEGVSPLSRQGTYAAVEFRIENWRWAGVPFFVRSGKRLKAKASEILLHFKTPPHVPFALSSPLGADRLVLRLVPDEGISLRYNAKVPGQGSDLTKVSMDFYYDRQFQRPNPDAYETLLLDVMRGDATLFTRADEVEEQWKIVEPLLETWEASNAEPAFYKAGSWGPEEAEELLARRGRRWHEPINE
jgi:glucose-6-phosphate 1-dehydrogenase